MKTSSKDSTRLLLESERQPVLEIATMATQYIQPHGVLLIARQSDLRFLYVSANADRVTRIPAQQMLGRSILDCMSAEICSAIVHYDSRNRLVHDVEPRQLVVSGVGTRHHVTILHHGGLIYIEMELEVVEPEAERLPVRAQMILEKLRDSSSLPELLNATVAGVRELTGYARVMAYRFEPDGHGHVVAEDRAKGLVSFRHLRFPVADIPIKVRQRSLKHPVRVIANTQYEPVPMLHDPTQPLDVQPDMNLSGLRSGSPIQMEYVRKMGAGAVLMLSLIVNNELWGLLICHHTAPRLPSPEMRSTCELLSQIVSSLVQQRENAGMQADRAERDAAFRTIAAAVDERESIFEGLLSSQEQLLRLVKASGALIRMHGEAQVLGIAPSLAESSAIMKALRLFTGDGLFPTENLSAVIPETAHSAAGSCGVLMLAVPGTQGDGILWFRPEHRVVQVWGMKLGKKVASGSTTGEVFAKRRLGRWQSVLTDHSLPWESEDLEAAQILSRLLTNCLTGHATPGSSQLSSQAPDPAAPLGREMFEKKLQDWSNDIDRASAAVFLIGAEHFNLVDVAFGPSASAELVQQMMQRLAELRPDETVSFARLEANTFAFFCANCSEEEAQFLLRQLRAALDSPFTIQGRPFHLAVKLGLAHSEEAHDESLLRKAETALEFAKDSGAQIANYSSVLHEEVTRRIQLEQDLYIACEDNQFYLLYQPIVSLPHGELLGFEALLRWNHPTRGIIPPTEFIPLAEAQGLIVPVGKWVMHSALQQLRTWTEMCGTKLRMHVNVSALQLTDGDLQEYIGSLLDENGILANRLSVEVAESTLLCGAAAERLRELRATGVTISADDFGTGYSCLASLRKLPLDVVKIDKEFVQAISEDPRARDFVATILQLARTLELQTVGEGVETEEQAKTLADLGCPAAQGYHYSMPLTRDEATQLIERCREKDWQIFPAGRRWSTAA